MRAILMIIAIYKDKLFFAFNAVIIIDILPKNRIESKGVS